MALSHVRLSRLARVGGNAWQRTDEKGHEDDAPKLDGLFREIQKPCFPTKAQLKPPRYRQIEAYLRSQIANRAYPLGFKLPSELELARRFRVSRITVRCAMLGLQLDGLVDRRPGRGTIVASAVVVHNPSTFHTVDDEARSRGLAISYCVFSYCATHADTSVLGHLQGVDPVVFLLKRVKLIAGQPIAVENRFFPYHVGAMLTAVDVASSSVFALLMRALGDRPVRVSENYSSCNASKEQAALLGLPVRFPVFVTEHTMFDRHNVPVEYGKTAFRSDRYRVSVEFR